MTTQSLNSRVAGEVRAQLARRGLKQIDLRPVLGLSQASINARCKGKTPWTLDDVESLADFFDLPISRLVEAPDFVDALSRTPGYPVNDPDGDDYAVVLPFRRPAARTIPWMPPAPPRPHPRPYVVALEAVAS